MHAVASALAPRTGRLAAEAMALLEQRLPDYLRQLGFQREDPLAVAEVALEDIVEALATVGKPLPRTSRAYTAMGKRRAVQGFTLENLLDADVVHREVALRQVEAACAGDPSADATLLLAERRLDSHREQVILGLTHGYVLGHQELFEREHRELSALMSIMGAVGRSLDSREVAESALTQTIRAMGLEQGALWLFQRDRPGRLVLVCSDGLTPQERATIGPDLQPAGQVLEALESDLPVQGLLTPRRAIFPGRRSVLTCALRAKGETVGVMSVGCVGEREFSEHEIAFVALISDHVGTALLNAQQHVREARTDHLTGLANRPEFERAVQREVAGARRHSRPFTVMLLDLDHLKHINDSHGHLTGDAAIQAVAAALKHVLRASDVCARLGGDEFGVAMAEAGRTEALEIADRVRQALEEASRSASLPEPAGVSIGFATWEPPMDWRALLKRADERLYEDKRSRRAVREGTPLS